MRTFEGTWERSWDRSPREMDGSISPEQSERRLTLRAILSSPVVRRFLAPGRPHPPNPDYLDQVHCERGSASRSSGGPELSTFWRFAAATDRVLLVPFVRLCENSWRHSSFFRCLDFFPRGRAPEVGDACKRCGHQDISVGRKREMPEGLSLGRQGQQFSVRR